jgi:hypothetical protein
MADEKKTQASAKKPKPEAKAEAKPAAKAAEAKPAPKAAKPAAAKAAKPDKAGDAKAKGKATPPVTEGAHCSVDKCRQPIRAKGLCRKHFMAWRRGEAGDHHRYKTCSKEGCRKPRAKGGLCDEHAGTAAPAAAEGAAPAA